MKPLVLPDKLFFRIGEASRLVGVRPHVIRYWETEFRSIRPAKSRSGQRVYSRRDLEIIALIRHLLHDARYTIDGARKVLRERGLEEALGEVRRDTSASGLPAARRAARVLADAAVRLDALAHRFDRPLAAANKGLAKSRDSE